MADEGRSNLGRGLSSLLGDEESAGAEAGALKGFKSVPIEFLRAGRYQPRHDADDDQIGDLAQSIREQGILQPILVRRHPEEPDAFEIIAGERRWRAAQLAELHQVPVVVKELSDQESLEIALVENLQRQDLSALEEAEGYRRLMDEFSYAQEGLAQAVGKSRSHVANMMRLLGLPDPVKELLQDGKLSAGHARALLKSDRAVALARRIVDSGLNVRQTEALVQAKGKKAGASKKGRKKIAKDADTVVLERDLAALLGLKVEIEFGHDGGTLTLHYGSLEQLDDILHRLSHGSHGARMDAADDAPPGDEIHPDPTQDGSLG
jgi:ParB family chromosome partitioning protein